MEEDRVASGLNQHRNARRFDLTLTGLLALTWVRWACAAPMHFDLPAGDAGVMLNRFSVQSDIQVLFDFSQLTGKNTNAVVGDMEPAEALRAMLKGLPVGWKFVNEHTLALTLNADEKAQPAGSRLHRWWQSVASKSSRPTPDSALEQVLVAGSNTLYQAPPVGASLIRLDRLDIERSGFATTQDLIHTLPQVFGGGPSEDTSIGREAPTNSSKGSGINLRGLDAGATLVLIDGQRTAPSGGTGAFADISNIPLSAIDHVDILPDGASAQFGADAIGGVVNFVLRSNFVGAETHLREGDLGGNPLGDRVFSQVLGGHWGESSTAMLGFEWYDRGALPSNDRLQATSNLLRFGGTNFDVPYGTPGTILVGSRTWAIPAAANGQALQVGALAPGEVNLYDSWAGVDVLPDQERWSAFGTLRNEVRDGVELFADSLFTRRRMGEVSTYGLPLRLTVLPSNPFYVDPTGAGGPIAVETGSQAYFGAPRAAVDVDTGNFNVGMNLHLGNTWTLNLHGGYTFENQDVTTRGLFDAVALNAALADADPATAFDPFGGGSANNPATLASLERTGESRSRSNMKLVGFTAAGSLFHAPGGAAILTAGTEYRDQTFDTTTVVLESYPVSIPSSIPTVADLSRRVHAEFAELRVPLFGSDNSRELLRALEISFGARSEEYSDVGHAAVPKAGFLWSPASSVTVRGTWTRSFRPPLLPDVAPNNSFSQIRPLPDSGSSSGATAVLLVSGTNPHLDEERARTWTLGAQLTPATVPGLSLGWTYFNTYYSNRIELVQLQPDVLNQPQLAWLVSRSFTAGQRSQICSQTLFAGSADDCVDAPIGAIVDNRLHNVEHLETDGIDVFGKYAFTGSAGHFDLGLNGTYLLGYSEQKTPGTPVVELLNTQNNPINLRLRSSVSWERASLGASLYVNFDNGYRDVASVPSRSVRSFTTLDLQVRYHIGQYGGYLANTEFALSAQNLLNSSPPFLNNPLGVGYDQENADLTGRILSVDVRKRW